MLAGACYPCLAQACTVTGRLSGRLYVAFAPFIVMGTLEAGMIACAAYDTMQWQSWFSHISMVGPVIPAQCSVVRQHSAACAVAVDIGLLSVCFTASQMVWHS